LSCLLEDKKLRWAVCESCCFSKRRRRSSAAQRRTADANVADANASDANVADAMADVPAAPRRRRAQEDTGVAAPGLPGAAIVVSHPSLQAGDACPECAKGTVYNVAQPGVILRFLGQPPVQATVYELQKLRCGLCGKMFTAPAPEGVGEEKYDATVASMIGVLKYGSGMPFNRPIGCRTWRFLCQLDPVGDRRRVFAGLTPAFRS
jgi:hypothetical protein